MKLGRRLVVVSLAAAAFGVTAHKLNYADPPSPESSARTPPQSTTVSQAETTAKTQPPASERPLLSAKAVTDIKAAAKCEAEEGFRIACQTHLIETFRTIEQATGISPHILMCIAQVESTMGTRENPPPKKLPPTHKSKQVAPSTSAVGIAQYTENKFLEAVFEHIQSIEQTIATFASAEGKAVLLALKHLDFVRNFERNKSQPPTLLAKLKKQIIENQKAKQTAYDALPPDVRKQILTARHDPLTSMLLAACTLKKVAAECRFDPNASEYLSAFYAKHMFGRTRGGRIIDLAATSPQTPMREAVDLRRVTGNAPQGGNGSDALTNNNVKPETPVGAYYGTMQLRLATMANTFHTALNEATTRAVRPQKPTLTSHPLAHTSG